MKMLNEAKNGAEEGRIREGAASEKVEPRNSVVADFSSFAVKSERNQ